MHAGAMNLDANVLWLAWLYN